MADRARSAIAVLFPEPESDVEFNLILARLRNEFAGQEKIRVVAAVRNAADRIEAILDQPMEELSGDVTVIGQDCITNGEVISYRGENFYKACDQWVVAVDGEGQSFCVKRSGHNGYIHEDIHGNFRDATDDEAPEPEVKQ